MNPEDIRIGDVFLTGGPPGPWRQLVVYGVEFRAVQDDIDQPEEIRLIDIVTDAHEVFRLWNRNQWACYRQSAVGWAVIDLPFHPPEKWRRQRGIR